MLALTLGAQYLERMNRRPPLRTHCLVMMLIAFLAGCNSRSRNDASSPTDNLALRRDLGDALLQALSMAVDRREILRSLQPFGQGRLVSGLQLDALPFSCREASANCRPHLGATPGQYLGPGA
jgi:hypothetical protein